MDTILSERTTMDWAKGVLIKNLRVLYLEYKLETRWDISNLEVGILEGGSR